MSGRRSFSLPEVIVAVGILAAGLVVALGAMAALTRSLAVAEETDKATAAALALTEQLRTLPFATVAAWLEDPAAWRARTADPSYEPENDPLALFVDQEGNRVGRGNDSVWAGREAEEYAVAALLRDPVRSPRETDSKAAWLAFTIRLSWPAFVPGPGGPVAVPWRSQEVLLMPASVRR